MPDPLKPKDSQAQVDLEDAIEAGNARNGRVDLRSFDEGIVLTLGAQLGDDPNTGINYFLEIDGYAPPADLPGVPVTFAFPEEVFEKYRMPVVVIRRDDLYPAMQRWHPRTIEYVAPSLGANPASVTQGSNTLTGFTHYDYKFQAVPYDIMYTVSIIARNRGDREDAGRWHASRLLSHVYKSFPPYGSLKVKDSLGYDRTYEVFSEGTGMLDSTPEVGTRIIGFAVTLRVEAELDLGDPITYRAVTEGQPTVNTVIKALTT